MSPVSAFIIVRASLFVDAIGYLFSSACMTIDKSRSSPLYVREKLASSSIHMFRQLSFNVSLIVEATVNYNTTSTHIIMASLI